MTRKLLLASILTACIGSFCAGLLVIPFNTVSNTASTVIGNLLSHQIEVALTTEPPSSPIPTLPPGIVLAPVDSNGSSLALVPAQVTCVIYIKQSTGGIHIYPDLDHTFNMYKIGDLLATDGIVAVLEIGWTDAPEGKQYRWARVHVREIMGWVHADPIWTAKPASC